MGAIEDLGLHYRPMARAVPEQAPPKEHPVSEHVLDELIDEERKEWGRVEQDRRGVAELARPLDRMLIEQVPDQKQRARVVQRLSEWMVHHDMPVTSEEDVRKGVLALAKRAVPLDLGGMHPALKAYAYIQAVKNGGAQT